MNAIETKILKTLGDESLSRTDVISKLPVKYRPVAGAAINTLIMGNKLGIKDGLLFRLSKPSKMHNKNVVIDGMKFASIKEGNRYRELRALERSLVIKDLIMQPKFKIVGRVKYKGKTLGARYYIADFQYLDGETLVVEDVKSEHTIKDAVYTLKRQLFLLAYPEIDFREIL